MNLCEGAGELLHPHPLFWLKIGVEIENEESFCDGFYEDRDFRRHLRSNP